MRPERWRCFVAVPIAESLRADLRTAAEAWHSDLSEMRWTYPDGWHVTLAFLGSVEARTIPELVARVASVAERHPALRLETGGLGAFPSAARARVAWYGVRDRSGALGRLAGDVAIALGLDAAQAFHPHLTLARARQRSVDLRPWLASASVPGGTLEVDQVVLMRSHTGRGPARYETLATIALGGVPAHV